MWKKCYLPSKSFVLGTQDKYKRNNHRQGETACDRQRVRSNLCTQKEVGAHEGRAIRAGFLEEVAPVPGLREGLDLEVLGAEDILGQMNYKQG